MCMDEYRRHNAAVKAMVPSSQLLVYRVTEGWEPLCQFLCIEVPDIPFPHENKVGQPGNIVEKFHKFGVYRRAMREVRNSLLCLGLCLTAVVIVGMCIFTDTDIKAFFSPLMLNTRITLTKFANNRTTYGFPSLEQITTFCSISEL